MLASLLGTTFVGLNGVDNVAVLTGMFQNGIGAAGFFAPNSDDGRPYAFLNYILFDEAMQFVDAGAWRVDEDGAFGVGRWQRVDPKRQQWSPYLAMGNNPVFNVDPDGGWKYRWQAVAYRWMNGGEVEQAIGGSRAGEWYVGNQVGHNTGVQYNRVFNLGIEASAETHIDFSVGLQLGWHLRNAAGIDGSLASWTMWEGNWKVGYSSEKGLSIGPVETLSNIWHSRVKTFIAADMPGLGGSLNMTQMMGDPDKTLDMWVNFHGGHPLVGLQGEERLGGPNEGRKDLFLGGGGGARAIGGVDLEYKLRFSRK